jgi:hypothetical protein
LIKTAATTLGETGGETVSMSMALGYLAATAIFALIFLIAVACNPGAPGTRRSFGRERDAVAIEDQLPYRRPVPQSEGHAVERCAVQLVARLF